MRHHDILDGQARSSVDGRAESLSIREAAAGIHDGDGVTADNEADVGDGIVVG
jgi:hypothetical protein